jgi:glycosyltransferase involved in cell wall biosynthesis
MIICVVPLGLHGKGGIERLFLHIDRLKSLPEVQFLTSRGDNSFIWSLGVFGAATLRLTAMLAFKPRAIVHLNVAINASAYRKWLLGQIARIFGARVVVHFHGSGFDRVAHESALWVRFNRRTMRKADAVIALGESWRKLFIDLGVSPERVHVVYNGAPDFAQGRIRERAPGAPVRILFAGEVGPRKGADLLINALIRLKNSPGWTCTVAGNGAISKYQARIENAGLSSRVTFTGWVSPEAMRQLMLQADIVILPSRAEALPMSLIEGAAAGAALVATDVGATREIIDESCGAIVEADDAEIARTLQQLIADPVRLGALQAGARRRYLEKFTFDRMIAGLRRVYLSVSKQDSRDSWSNSAEVEHVRNSGVRRPAGEMSDRGPVAPPD